MDIYVGSASRQRMRIHIRLPEIPRLRTLTIGSGQQDVIKDLSQAQVDSVVKYLQKFGALTPAEVGRSMIRYDGILYRVDRQLSQHELEYGFEAQIDYAQSRSVQENTRSALAADRDPLTKKRRAIISEHEIEQDAPGGRPTGKEVKMSITISPDGNENTKLPV